MKSMFNMNIFKKTLFITLLSTAGFLVASNFVSAQKYQIHEKIPGQVGRSGSVGGVDYGAEGIDTLQDYLESAYKFGIAIVGILAVVMIGVGGFMYIVTSAGNAGKLADAKEIITSAILGLVMALLSWLILFVINPDLVGNTLKGVELDRDNNAWKNDTDSDPEICNNKLGAYESGECSGSYFCVQDTCVSKNNKICLLADQPKIEGVCHESDPVAEKGDECGITIATQNLSGTCEKGPECGGGRAEIYFGKKCIDGSICCEGAGGANTDHYGRD
jgi:hypothetical protein